MLYFWKLKKAHFILKILCKIHLTFKKFKHSLCGDSNAVSRAWNLIREFLNLSSRKHKLRKAQLGKSFPFRYNSPHTIIIQTVSLRTETAGAMDCPDNHSGRVLTAGMLPPEHDHRHQVMPCQRQCDMPYLSYASDYMCSLENKAVTLNISMSTNCFSFFSTHKTLTGRQLSSYHMKDENCIFFKVIKSSYKTHS